jgi:2-polyprenyl-6-methoxyphenol hydroxylase-like FAD-dependent oxidoreductase
VNTGVGDAADLGWKLAAEVAGWGGANLLDSYQAERRPMALRTIAEARPRPRPGRDAHELLDRARGEPVTGA